MSRRGIIYCSFCGRPEGETNKIIAGPNWNFICDECILQGVRIVAQKYPAFRAKVLVELDQAVQQEIKTACHAAATPMVPGDEQPVQPPPVCLLEGARAMHAAGYTNDLSERDGFIQEEYLDQAKACAEAWGLKWKS